MWNILVVIIIAILIWAFNPLAHLNQSTSVGDLNQKTKDQINQVVDRTVQQVNQSNNVQQKELDNSEP